jgi:hypothetical protein
MKKILTLLVLTLIGFSSCGDDDNNDNSSGTGIILKVHATYSTDANGIETHPDAGAKVYLFFDFNHKNTNGYSYQAGGKYVKGSEILTPDQTATIASDGYVTINAKFRDRPLTVVVDSKHYEGRYSEVFYEKFKENEVFACIFKPQ